MEEAFQVGCPFVALEVVEQKKVNLVVVVHIQQELMVVVDHHIHQGHHHQMEVEHQEMLGHILNGQFLGPQPQFFIFLRNLFFFENFEIIFLSRFPKPINEFENKINLVALGD